MGSSVFAEELLHRLRLFVRAEGQVDGDTPIEPARRDTVFRNDCTLGHFVAFKMSNVAEKITADLPPQPSGFQVIRTAVDPDDGHNPAVVRRLGAYIDCVCTRRDFGAYEVPHEAMLEGWEVHWSAGPFLSADHGLGHNRGVQRLRDNAAVT